MFRPARRQLNTHCRALGIDLGRYSIKAVVVEETENGLVVSHAASVLTPNGVMDQGIVTDKASVAAIIRQLVKDFGVPITSAALSTPIDQTLVRWVDMPQLDENALASAAKFEAKKYVPFIYWLAVVLISIFGTLITDILTDSLAFPLEASTITFSVA